MGEFVTNQQGNTKSQKKNKKHKFQNNPTSQEPDISEPPTKLRKPQAPTKKSHKKVKQAERQQKEREVTFDKYKGTATIYLESWKGDKSNWKFNKNVQNWIVTHLYDSKLLPDSVWPITLEYFAGSKGAAKQNIIDEATKIIEDEETSENTDDTKESIKRSRAKDIIQFIVE